MAATLALRASPERGAGSNPAIPTNTLAIYIWEGSQGGQGTCLKNRLCRFDSDPSHNEI